MRNKILLTLTVLLLAGLALSACSAQSEMPTVLLPAGMAYAEGKEIYFIHTEASDAEVAQLLTDMMASPVLLVPELANAPESALAPVYVFENGIEGMGPLGYQADVFDNPPGSQGYTPLRRIHLVAWADAAQPRLITSAADLLTAQASGEVSITRTEIVVNMPFVVWDGGKR